MLLNLQQYKFLLAALLLLSAAGCKGDKSETVEEKKEKTMPLVKVITVEPSDFHKKIEFVGSCRAKTLVTVSSEEPGLIKGLYFDKGDEVKKGMLLLGLDDTLFQASLKELKASYEIARLNYEKLLALKKGRGAVTDFDLKNALLKANMAEAKVESIKAQMNKKKIFSPIDGVIEARQVEIGEYVTPGQPVATIADLEWVKVEAAVAEKELPYFAVGTVAEIAFNAYPGEVFSGVIDYISPMVDRRDGTFTIEINLENNKKRFKPGMMTRVRLVKQRCKNCLLVPQDAVLDDNNKTDIFIVTPEGIARRKAVNLGETADSRVVVSEGLNAGDRVVVVGQRDLLDGEKVTVIP